MILDAIRLDQMRLDRLHKIIWNIKYDHMWLDAIRIDVVKLDEIGSDMTNDWYIFTNSIRFEQIWMWPGQWSAFVVTTCS